MTATSRPLLSALSIALLLILLGFGPAPASCAETAVAPPAAEQPPTSAPAAVPAKESPLPTQYGMSAEFGYAYDPSPNPTFLLARVFAIYDYGTVWRNDRCPNTLRFKVEGAVGSTLAPDRNLILSANMLAMKYFMGLNRPVRPYVEGGIGVIYTQFRVKGQGLHVNFNPLLGVGLELPQPDGKNLFTAFRLHHISNSELYHDNRGVNSVILQVGRFF